MSSGTSGKGAPDYNALAQTMGSQQQGLLQQQTYANRPNVSTPYGSISWTAPTGPPPDYYGARSDPSTSGNPTGETLPPDAANASDAAAQGYRDYADPLISINPNAIPSMGGSLGGLLPGGHGYPRIIEDMIRRSTPPGATSPIPPPLQPTRPAPAPGTTPSQPGPVPTQVPDKFGTADGTGKFEGSDTNPQWGLNVTLSPEQQALLDQQEALGQGSNAAALERLGAGISGQNVQDALYSQLTNRLDPRMQKQMEQQRTQLYNMGLREGDAAYNEQMARLGETQNDAYQNAAWQSILGGDQSAASQVNLINALRSGGQATMPQQPGFSQAGQGQATDLLGAANASAAYSAQNNPLATIAQIAPLIYMMSDERLKTDIRRLSIEALPGVPFASWKWKTGGRGFGVIAQDLEKVRPDLVMRGEDGFLRVNYAGIGV